MCYVPHHNPKKPANIRVMFDCNAKFHEKSLNDCLIQGPDLTNALICVLCRFRREPVAIMCDIKQLFYQFNVNQEHREYLRLLWWEVGMHETQPSEYRMADLQYTCLVQTPLQDVPGTRLNVDQKRHILYVTTSTWMTV